MSCFNCVAVLCKNYIIIGVRFKNLMTMKWGIWSNF